MARSMACSSTPRPRAQARRAIRGLYSWARGAAATRGAIGAIRTIWAILGVNIRDILLARLQGGWVEARGPGQEGALGSCKGRTYLAAPPSCLVPTPSLGGILTSKVLGGFG